MNRQGGYTYRIHGAIYHRIGSLLPADGVAPAFSQVYIHDTASQIDFRDFHSRLNPTTKLMIQQLMHAINPHVSNFRTLAERYNDQPPDSNFRIRIQAQSTPDRRRYNSPTDEVGIVFDEDDCRPMDIVLHGQSNTLTRINETHQFYDSFQYVLMFPEGDREWQLYLPITPNGSKNITPMQWYSARLMYFGDDCLLLWYGRLLQQYMVDMYVKIEKQRLRYQMYHQKELRSDLYNNIADAAVSGADNMDNQGRKIILSSSFIGGKRHMRQLYMDAMNIVRRYGRPDLFITFTCNPLWKEIQDELQDCQTSMDRPDLVTRVFRLKLDALMDDLTKKSVLGKVIAHIRVVEFQKRGLPHAHILLILANEDKLNTDDYDSVVSAEIPDPSIYPEAYRVVTSSMMHGPCGPDHRNSPCMVNGVCSKGFPKNFALATVDSGAGYPIYRRRDLGLAIEKKGVPLNNRWVVPHNVYLCTKYNAHLNVEICSSITAVKYLYKYVYKGHDRASMEVDNGDEIKEYVDGRYVSASEACYRIFGFSLHKEFPTSERLAIHLENAHMVYFDGSQSAPTALGRSKDSTLLGWFRLNQTHPEARQYLYLEIPEHFTWVKSTRCWKPRQGGFGAILGRVYTVAASNVELYHMRQLLYHVPGALG
ncbi:hypothetical protein, partial, partial [Absidia glauca]